MFLRFNDLMVLPRGSMAPAQPAGPDLSRVSCELAVNANRVTRQLSAFNRLVLRG
jgi:hypothetical protein